LLTRWRVSIGTGYLRRRGGTWVSIVQPPLHTARFGVRPPAPNCGAEPSGLCLNPSESEHAILVRREVSLSHPGIQRLYFRAWFYDDSRGGSHWAGVSTKTDGGAVGIHPVDPLCYCVLKTWSVDAPGEGTWASTGVKRSRGWHIFAVELQANFGTLLVDKRRVSTRSDFPACVEIDSMWLGASGTASGHWGGVELLHIPLNRGLWELDENADADAVETPWVTSTMPTETMKPAEDPVDSGEVVTHEILPEPAEFLADESPDLTEESPAPTKVPPTKTRRRPKRRSPSPARTVAGLQIECWSVPDESQVQRLDRVMDVFLEKLLEGRVTIPENIKRVEECSEPGHASCYVYSFGTRRVHITTREHEGGRLTLVVRCGGGYLDFMEFAARHGKVEDLRMKRLVDSQGHERIELTSVMSRGAVRLAESCGGINSTLPSQRSRPSTGRAGGSDAAPK